jgi:hypothetical protein
MSDFETAAKTKLVHVIPLPELPKLEKLQLDYEKLLHWTQYHGTSNLHYPVGRFTVLKSKH